MLIVQIFKQIAIIRKNSRENIIHNNHLIRRILIQNRLKIAVKNSRIDKNYIFIAFYKPWCKYVCILIDNRMVTAEEKVIIRFTSVVHHTVVRIHFAFFVGCIHCCFDMLIIVNVVPFNRVGFCRHI